MFKTTFVMVTLLLSLIMGYAQANSALDDSLKIYSMPGEYKDIRLDLEYAITGRGIKINNISHIGDMLVRTGKDIGRNEKIFAQAEAIEFCSATLSRNMMLADPRNIIFCPYLMYIYTLPDNPDMVYVAYRRFPVLKNRATMKAFAAVVKVFEGIIEDMR